MDAAVLRDRPTQEESHVPPLAPRPVRACASAAGCWPARLPAPPTPRCPASSTTRTTTTPTATGREQPAVARKPGHPYVRPPAYMAYPPFKEPLALHAVRVAPVLQRQPLLARPVLVFEAASAWRLREAGKRFTVASPCAASFRNTGAPARRVGTVRRARPERRPTLLALRRRAVRTWPRTHGPSARRCPARTRAGTFAGRIPQTAGGPRARRALARGPSTATVSTPVRDTSPTASGEWVRLVALVPEQGDPSAGLEQPVKLPQCSPAVEPVERLGRDDAVRGCVWQARCLSRAVAVDGGGPAGRRGGYRPATHCRVRLDADDLNAPFGEQPGRNAGPAARRPRAGMLDRGWPCNDRPHGLVRVGTADARAVRQAGEPADQVFRPKTRHLQPQGMRTRRCILAVMRIVYGRRLVSGRAAAFNNEGPEEIAHDEPRREVPAVTAACRPSPAWPRRGGGPARPERRGVRRPAQARYHYAFKRLHEIFTARITAEPIYELKTGFSHHAYLCAEHVEALRTPRRRDARAAAGAGGGAAPGPGESSSTRSSPPRRPRSCSSASTRRRCRPSTRPWPGTSPTPTR